MKKFLITLLVLAIPMAVWAGTRIFPTDEGGRVVDAFAPNPNYTRNLTKATKTFACYSTTNLMKFRVYSPRATSMYLNGSTGNSYPIKATTDTDFAVTKFGTGNSNTLNMVCFSNVSTALTTTGVYVLGQ